MLVQTRVKKRKDVSAKWEEIREGHVEGMKRARFPAGARAHACICEQSDEFAAVRPAWRAGRP